MNPIMFRILDEDEKIKLRQWARKNYVKNSPIFSLWHPVVQNECDKINAESKEKACISTECMP